MEVNKELNDEIWNYCRTNNITNIDEFMLKCLKQGFTVEKFGASPTIKEKIVEKEIEKIVEVPVEKIVEKIVEVTVEKEVYITDNKEMQKLTKEIERLNKNGKLASEAKDKALNELAEKEIELKKVKIELEQEKKKKKTDLYGE
jgi:hypothetical protein